MQNDDKVGTFNLHHEASEGQLDTRTAQLDGRYGPRLNGIDFALI